MKPGDIEIKWEMLSKEAFDSLQEKVASEDLISSGLKFPTQKLPLNVSYENKDFKNQLQEKFSVVKKHAGAPNLYFIKYDRKYGVDLPFTHYGYVAPDWSNAIVFAESFGIFKSVISGFSSALLDSNGYIPAHASVLQVNDRGILFVGGSGAGKTTTLLNLIEPLRTQGINFGVLTDDWAVIKVSSGNIIAETFDPSISLRQRNLDENPDAIFYHHDSIVRSINERVKISLSPHDLYGIQADREMVIIDLIILLDPQEGENILRKISADTLAESATRAAYHYPYVNSSQINRHKKLWRKISQLVPVYSFYTRSINKTFQDLSVIQKAIVP